MNPMPLPPWSELDHYCMQQALILAQQAYDEGEVPIGAVVLAGRRIIGKGYNQTEMLRDVTAHAEMIAMTAASNYLGGKYLTDCTLYVTVEPCPMCAGALYWSHIQRVVYATADPKRGYSTIDTKLLHPKTEVAHGLNEDEARALMQQFFKRLR